ncbi:cupin domain-containing protein [Streptomyces platensis]
MRVTRTPQPTATAPPEWVNGAAGIEEIVALGGSSRFRVDSVHFAPGARTAWHRHPLGQVLHVTAGTGLVQCRGGEVHTIRTGDTVHIAPGEWH